MCGLIIVVSTRIDCVNVIKSVYIILVVAILSTCVRVHVTADYAL